jgi:type IV pilus assembly protein PilV
MKNIIHQRGVGLIEVLVTLLILSTSLITLTAMQNRSLQFNQMAYFRSQANIMAYDILDRIRLNRLNLDAYDVALAAFGGGSAPATGNMVATDIYQWRQGIDARIPGGQGGIECDNATRICNITISWSEINSVAETNDEDESTSEFLYSARL